MTASAAGLYGNAGQGNYGAAKLALYGFGRTLAREGAKKGIHCNIIAPIAGSRITETVLPPDLVAALKPELVAPWVAWLVHEQCGENGGVFEVGAGAAAAVRWERAPGALLKVNDPHFGPAACAQALPQANAFTPQPVYPQSMSDVDWVGLAKQSQSLPPLNAKQAPPLSWSGRTVIVTGGGAGLGRVYALLFAKAGARVLVNDVGEKGAAAVVAEIRSLGGRAAPSVASVEDADRILTDLKAWAQADGGKGVGRESLVPFRVDVLINNAGILRDKSFAKMSDAEWEAVQRVHLRGTFKMCKAVWPVMLGQKYGRILNTSSAVGLYGNFGQANYSAAKAGILGLTLSLAQEGSRHGILVNCIAPNAGTAMTATILPPEVVAMLKPDFVAPWAAMLCHETCQESGGVWEVGSGWMARVRWQRAAGVRLPNCTLETVKQAWPQVSNYTRSTYPRNAQESFMLLIDSKASPSSSSASPSDSGSTDAYEVSKDKVILYNLGIGCPETDLEHVYEGAGLKAVPTFGVIPAFALLMSLDMNKYVDGYNPAMLLHGEHALELKVPQLPLKGKLTSQAQLVGVAGKGDKGTTVVIRVETRDEQQKVVAVNQGTLFLRGAKPKAGVPELKDKGSVPPKLPSSPPEKTMRQSVALNQAAIYRLSGDKNPLHVDPAFAAAGGFTKPILHGLCSFGYAARHLEAMTGQSVKMIRGRFARHVIPGETLQTELWRLPDQRVAFQVRVVERDELCITNGLAELFSGGLAKEAPSAGEAEKVSAKTAELVKGFQRALASLPKEQRKQQVERVRGILQFAVKTAANSTAFFIDLKQGEGSIGLGPSPSPADLTISVGEDDLIQLAKGRLNGQQAFLKGLVKVKGNMAMAMKLDGIMRALSGQPSKL